MHLMGAAFWSLFGIKSCFGKSEVRKGGVGEVARYKLNNPATSAPSIDCVDALHRSDAC